MRAARSHAPPGLILTALFCATLAAAWVALALGASATGWRDVLGFFQGRIGTFERMILIDVRLPRIVLAGLVGAALSGAGVAFQGVLRNPLADPYILGVSGGSALGAVLYTLLAVGDPLQGSMGRPLSAFAGALSTVLLLFGLTRLSGRTGTLSMLLIGVVLNAFYSAVILFLVSVGDPSRFQEVLLYLIGSLAFPPPWPMLGWLALLVAAGGAVLGILAYRLNLLAFGEETAGQLGVPVEWTTWTLVGAASLITAAAVALSGIVGFVGLLVPHAVRGLCGPDHRLLVPSSALAGAAFLILADTAARTLLGSLELPVGVVTALVGGPFFLVLFHRRLRSAVAA